jgi:hypothetical protein
MFDYVTLASGEELQTKSLGCNLDRYRIDAEGQLRVSRYEMRGWAALSAGVPIDLCPDDEYLPEEPVTDLTGEIELHRYDRSLIARFEDGKLISLVTLEEP